jgi:biopolymer transport protein ExbD
MYQDPLPEMNLTPMIDIVFNLIIFFMVGTRFAEMERSLELRVPRVSAQKALPSVTAHRVVSIFRDGTIHLDHQPIELSALQAQLQADVKAQPHLKVTFRGDGEAVLKRFAQVVAACRDSGVHEFAMAVEEDVKRR